MKKIEIDGMMCGHCTAAVEKALKGLNLTKVEVSLEQKAAFVEGDATDEQLKSAIEDLGFDVVSISD